MLVCWELRKMVRYVHISLLLLGREDAYTQLYRDVDDMLYFRMNGFF